MTKFFTAICFDAAGKPYKYRNIQNKAGALQSFERFCNSKNIIYINYYCKASRAFIRRNTLQNTQADTNASKENKTTTNAAK